MDESLLMLTGDDGSETPFQLLDPLTLGGRRYAVLAPLDQQEPGGVLLMRVLPTPEGERYEPIEDEREEQRVFDLFRTDDEDYEFCDAE